MIIYRDSSPKIEMLPIYYSLILSMEELVTANPCDHSGISWKESIPSSANTRDGCCGYVFKWKKEEYNMFPSIFVSTQDGRLVYMLQEPAEPAEPAEANG